MYAPLGISGYRRSDGEQLVHARRAPDFRARHIHGEDEELGTNGKSEICAAQKWISTKMMMKRAVV